jgi:F-type H+-transporting ATPase subunit epsilon
LSSIFNLRILTPCSLEFEGKVKSVILPGEQGEFEVLYNHTNFISTLRPGVLRFVSEGKTTQFTINAGFAEVHKIGVTVLADSIIKDSLKAFSK